MKHLCHTAGIVVVVCNILCWCSLDLLQLGDVFPHMWIPDCWCTFDYWPNVASACRSFDLTVFCPDIAVKKGSSAMSLFGDSTDMFVEVQLGVNSNSQQLGWVDNVQSLSVYGVRCRYRFLFQSHPKDLTFGRIEFHHPLFFNDWSAWRSFCRLTVSASEEIRLYSTVSSANKGTVDEQTESGRLLI